MPNSLLTLVRADGFSDVEGHALANVVPDPWGLPGHDHLGVALAHWPATSVRDDGGRHAL